MYDTPLEQAVEYTNDSKLVGRGSVVVGMQSTLENSFCVTVNEEPSDATSAGST